MTNEEHNTALYQKMFAEQETFRDWLKDQPPEEILNHAYEYTIREDILLSLEYHNLSDAQIDALMESPSPLADVFRDFEKLETDYGYRLGLHGKQSGYGNHLLSTILYSLVLTDFGVSELGLILWMPYPFDSLGRIVTTSDCPPLNDHPFSV